MRAHEKRTVHGVAVAVVVEVVILHVGLDVVGGEAPVDGVVVVHPLVVARLAAAGGKSDRAGRGRPDDTRSACAD